MSVENSNNCPQLTYPIVKHDETNIKLDYDSYDSKEWTTETQEIFVSPKVEDKKIGRRRELLMQYFKIRAAKDALEEMIGDPLLPESCCFTEYIDNFCDSDFMPLLEKSDFDDQKLIANPLYGGDIRTYYKEQFDKKNLKTNTEFRNLRRPFVRRTLFTTPPELALEEPIDGF